MKKSHNQVLMRFLLGDNCALRTFTFLILAMEITLLSYAFSIICFIMAFSLRYPALKKIGTLLVFAAFLLNTLILGLRCYILGRPPVSNMYETMLYVPWVSVAVSLVFWVIWKRSIFLFSSACIAFSLLVVLLLSNLNMGLENVQAVLNSQYWLIIHVLMVVGSYGAFLLSGAAGHLYLLSSFSRNSYPLKQSIAQFLLQSMYVGTALLIPGTILGGVWAAESWGRFWDWDPKESWAFISSCVYLVVIHAYGFQYLNHFGLAIGSIVGLQAITF